MVHGASGRCTGYAGPPWGLAAAVRRADMRVGVRPSSYTMAAMRRTSAGVVAAKRRERVGAGVRGGGAGRGGQEAG